MSTAIIGEGWVGKAQHQLFPESVVYDEPKIRNANQFTSQEQEQVAVDAGRLAVNECDITFVCVPTPNNDRGELDTSIVEEVVAWCESDLIVVRSTVNPGTCDQLAKKYDKRVMMQPEYLGETPNHPMLDPKVRQFMVIGGKPNERRQLIEEYTGVYNANTNIRQVSAYEAEVIKLTENRAIAFKVAQCQELYDACQAAGIDYYTIRDAVYGDDPRFDLWFSFIFPESRGMNSKCIPKDVYAWAAWAESLNFEPKITNAILEKNVDWLNLNA